METVSNNELARRVLWRFREDTIWNNKDLKKLLTSNAITPEQYEFFKFERVKEKSLSGGYEFNEWPRIAHSYDVTYFRGIDTVGGWDYNLTPAMLKVKRFVRNTIPWEDGYEKVNINSIDFASGRFFIEGRHSSAKYRKPIVMRQVFSLDDIWKLFDEYIDDELSRYSYTLTMYEFEGIKK